MHRHHIVAGQAPKASAVWYNAKRWRKKRVLQLSQHPLCVSCLGQGYTVQATVADHVVPHKENEELFWSGRLQSLCAVCHNSYKQHYENTGQEQGCGPDGSPLDPMHHWNAKRLPI